MQGRREVPKKSLHDKLSLHLEWLSSDEKNGERFDVSGANVERSNFVKKNLSKAIFKGANVKFADFSSADLQEAGFSGAVPILL